MKTTRNFRVTKELINRLGVGGIIFFYLKIPGLRKKNQDVCYNVSSPIRKDSNPSLSIKRNPSNNEWYYLDFGDSTFRGDVFDFAAHHYGLDVVNDFPSILERMYDDLQIDYFDKAEVEKLMNGEPAKIDFTPIIGKRSAIRRDECLEDSKEKCEVVLHEKSENDLSEGEKLFMKKYGITQQAMKNTDTCFLSGYSLVYESCTKNHKVRDGEILLGYKYNGGAKVYCPYPKKFWHLGKRPKGYRFGTPLVTPQFEDETIVFLVGGEKDVLSLMSRGFNAMCLNSETSNITRDDLKHWYYDCHYNVIVMYDIDETGVAQAKKLKEQLGLRYILLPQWLKEKSGKDISDFFLHGGTVEELNNIVKDQTQSKLDNKELDQVTEHRLRVRTASQRIDDARHQKDICPFFDVFFQYEELVIMFGDTGKGKSIAAVALADAISKGQSFMGLENAYSPLPVLYYDFELSDKQFAKRYTSDHSGEYLFNDSFFIDNVDLATLTPKVKGEKFEDLIINRIREDINVTNAKVVIIDNVTYLTTHSAEDTQVALTLMRLLKELKIEKSLSILVLAHTPKRPSSFGITSQDLAGSKHLSNFADGVFALGHSTKDPGLKYFIQVKPSRSGELKYDKENVFVCEIEKKDNFLTLVPKGLSKECDLLGEGDSESEAELIERAKQLHAEEKTIRQIADELGVSKSKVGRWLKK